MGTTTQQMVGKYLQERRSLGRLGPEALINKRSILHGFCDVAPVRASKITRRNVITWIDSTRRLAVNTRRSYFSQVRLFCRWLVEDGTLARDPFHGLDMPKETRALHRALDRSQITALFAACLTSRERVIVALGVQAGLRRAELADLEVGDVNLAGRTVTVRRGKGGHGRIVPLADEACLEVARYLSVEAVTAGPLLRSKRAAWLGVQPQTVGLDFRKLALRASVKGRSGDGVGTHSLRHTMASDVYGASRDVMAVSTLLGHANLNTTQRYVKGLDVEGLRVAVEGRRYAA